MAPNTNAHAFPFFDAIGRPELKTDPRFDSPGSRTANSGLYFEVRKQGLRRRRRRSGWKSSTGSTSRPRATTRSTTFWMTRISTMSASSLRRIIPAKARSGRTRPANTFSGGGREKLTHAPKLGEHTSEVLAEAGSIRRARSRR